MGEILFCIGVAWAMGAIIAGSDDWPVEDAILWPIEILRRYWTKHK